MPKPNTKKSETAATTKKPVGKEAAYLFLPWTCKHYPDRSEIEAYLPGRDWETIAEIPANPGVDAELIAEFVARTINGTEKSHDLLGQAAYALELCLAGGNITWEAEQEARVVLQRIKQSVCLP